MIIFFGPFKRVLKNFVVARYPAQRLKINHMYAVQLSDSQTVSLHSMRALHWSRPWASPSILPCWAAWVGRNPVFRTSTTSLRKSGKCDLPAWGCRQRARPQDKSCSKLPSFAPEGKLILGRAILGWLVSVWGLQYGLVPWEKSLHTRTRTRMHNISVYMIENETWTRHVALCRSITQPRSFAFRADAI